MYSSEITQESRLKSFVPVSPDSHFPIQNLPFGVFKPEGECTPRVGVAIGDRVLDLSVLEAVGHFREPELAGQRLFDRSSLNAFMALGRPAWKAARATISRLLSADEPTLRDDADLRAKALFSMNGVELLLPVEIGDYTDTTASSGSWYYRLKQTDLDGAEHFTDGVRVDVLTGVDEEHIPPGFVLDQNYPNPFNPATTISFSLPIKSRVTLSVYNTLGEKVATLVDVAMEAGSHTVVFDASSLASGVYLYRLTAGSFVSTKKIVLAR